MNRLYLFALVLVAIVSSAKPASAHALGAECKIRGERVEVEAYYDDNTPASKAKVQVLDSRKNRIADGRMDQHGKWSFPLPEPGRYQVVIDAGAGHKTKLDLTIPSAGAEEGATISEGPSRREFTRFPLMKVGLGLAILGCFSLAIWWLRSRRVIQAPGSSQV